MKMNILTVMAVASLTSFGAMAAKPVFYPSAPEQPRIQFLKSINGAAFFSNGGAYGKRFPGFDMSAQKETDPLKKPYGVATTPGKIFVCDTGAGIVRMFDLEKKYIINIGEGQLQVPTNIVIGTDGTRYVADTGLSKIVVFDAQNVFVKTIGLPSKMKATDIVILKGNLYVTDVKNSQVVIIDPKTGAEVSRFSKVGLGDGELLKATNLTSDTQGNVVVADTLGGKVSVFSDSGTYLRKFGSMGDGLGQFARPKGVVVDRENRLYAIDNAFENVQIFNAEGQLLLPFGDAGNAAGGVNMPVKIAIDYDNVKYFKNDIAPGYTVDYLIYVASQFGSNKINVYGFLKKI